MRNLHSNMPVTALNGGQSKKSSNILAIHYDDLMSKQRSVAKRKETVFINSSRKQ